MIMANFNIRTEASAKAITRLGRKSAIPLGHALPNYRFWHRTKSWQNDPFVRIDHALSPGLHYRIWTSSWDLRRAKPTELPILEWRGIGGLFITGDLRL